MSTEAQTGGLNEYIQHHLQHNVLEFGSGFNIDTWVVSFLLGMAFIATDLALEDGSDTETSRAAVQRMLAEAEAQGDEVIVSFMLPRDGVTRLLEASNVDSATRLAVSLWLDAPLPAGHFRVLALIGEQVRAATVDASFSGVTELEGAPISSSLLN